METSSLDDRSYRVIRLPNQLEALLVHDPETDKASAALDVNVGNFSDETDMPGMAHAVEHLLFMGTKKYPVENAYNVYLSAHSGSSNAYTASCSTNYYFDIAAKPSNGEEPSETNLSPLYGGLDRFAQFFIEPLFLPSTLDRELRAVDSENKKNLQSDQWRLHQLEKSLSNPNHPYCHFSTGNFEVLKTVPESKGIDVRQKFIDFHGKHYSANRMKLCVLGRESLDTLETWVAELFSDVVNKDLPQNRWETEVPFPEDRLKLQCFAKPVMDSRELNLYFPFLDEEKRFETQPSRYISHLVGHEGPGSIMAYIKGKGWANSLSAGAYSICPGTPGIFDCQVRLTKEGLKNYKEVVKVFFQYVSLLRESPPQDWIFDEQKGMADVDFRFKQKTPASRFTSKIASVMQKPLPREWLLSGQSRLRKFDPALIKQGLDLLRPDNFRMTLVSRDFPGDWDRKEAWYGTEFKTERIPDDFMAEINEAAKYSAKDRIPDLHLPHRNQFIPTKLEVEKKEPEKPALSPRVVRNDKVARTWFKKDDEFWVPKANLIVSCKNPIIFASAENSVKSKLFTDLVRDALEEYSYDAELAGLQYNVSLDSRGLFFEVSGYNDKLPVLLEQVLLTMRDLDVKDDRFEIVKERLQRGYTNCELQQPFTQIGDYISWLTSEHDYVVEQLVVELPSITAEAVRQFHKQIMCQLHIEACVHGNLYKEDALRLTDMLESILKPRVLPKEEWPIIRSLEFPPGSNYVFTKTLKDPANVNHCIEYYLHLGDKGDRKIRAKTQLLDQILHEPAFDQLRTKEQLGYVVFSGMRGSATTYGFRFIIQSERTSEYLESRIDSFLVSQATALANMSDAEFESNKRSVVVKRLEKLKNLDQETGRLWSQITNEYYDFEAAQRDAAQVNLLTKAEMVDFYATHMIPSSPQRAKLVVQLVAQGVGSHSRDVESRATETDTTPAPTNGTVPLLIKNVRDFKAGLSATAGARPIHDLSEFEDTDSKLFHLQSLAPRNNAHSPRNLPELHLQLAAKTSSSKKRKISNLPSAPTIDVSLDRHNSPDIPLQSCEQDDDALHFSFSAHTTSASAPDHAYLRADSLPPASSLPPRLQTNTTGSSSYLECTSSAASSPSGAYADLSIYSERGGDTPGPDSSLVATAPYPPGRGSSPFTKTTHHRAIMGGAAEVPERASSPLKRRASSMDPETADQDAKEDVEMVTAPPTVPPSDTADSSHAESPSGSTHDNTSSPLGTDIDSTSQMDTESDKRAAPEHPASLDQHVQAIKSLYEEQERSPLKEDQECFIVSKNWLAKVPGIGFSSKHAVNDLSSVPPVDNSDIILEVLNDPCVGDGVDILKKKFVRLKETPDLVPFPPAAWQLLMKWPGLKEDQVPILRFAHNNQSGFIQWELHPPVFSIHRLWSAHSTVPVEASLKSSNPPPGRLPRSRHFNFNLFLKQAKKVARIDFTQRVKVWSIPERFPSATSDPTVPTPPASPDNSQTTSNSSDPWNRMLLDVEAFLALEKGVQRVPLEVADQTADPDFQTKKDLDFFALIKDQSIVLDPHEEGTEWTSNFTASRGSNGSNSLTVPTRETRSGRVSPAPSGPLTRGRSKKSGRTPGCVGLGNLGNTCYMNAALQCVRSVEELTKYFLTGEWEKELNRDNVLAHNGEVASSYATLLKDIYKPSASSSVTPRQFKNTLSRHASQFAGYGQQDSQEFLGFLLDGLQEDLSRIKKKPYIEKPDSTDAMVNDPEAIRQMAEQVWDITKKRDDSVIADLFTGLYKSTLICPVCQKVSITFDPFNNLTLPLPVEEKFNQIVKFWPLNDKPINIRVELGAHETIRAMKQFVSDRTGVPCERLMSTEEWNKKFYKHHPDLATATEEMSPNDHVWVCELEVKPTNVGEKAQKQQRLGVPVRSLLDDDEQKVPSPWNSELAEKMLVPVFHRRPQVTKLGTHRVGSQRTQLADACPSHFIVVTPEEARNEDIIRRKILEKVASFTSSTYFSGLEETEGSDGTDPEIVGTSSSDAGSSNEGKVVAKSVKGEDDMVDVQMQDVGAARRSSAQKHRVKHEYNHKRPAWLSPDSFLPPQLQNLFEMSYFAESGSPLPTGNSLDEGKEYPRLSTRAPETPSSEDQFDNVTNSTASNEASSSDEASRRSTDLPPTRMNEESDEDDDDGGVVKANSEAGRKQRQQQRQARKNQQAFEAEEAFDVAESGPDGGPLIRLREAIVVDWQEKAYDTIFGDKDSAFWDHCDTLADPELDRIQAARATRKRNGTTLEACLDEFERNETLSEQDMWYCPRCKEHRQATKKFDLWKTPDILVIHLKRFSSSGFSRKKVDTLVEFPLENLDITSRVLQRSEDKEEVYDLIGVDCHYGGLGGGHYTAFAKNFVDGAWYSYNGKTLRCFRSNTSAYMLFYRRRSDLPLGGPRFQKIMDLFPAEDSSEEGLTDSGEGQRLGGGFSRNGSSSAFQGAEASRPAGNSGADSYTTSAKAFDSVVRIPAPDEDDEGIDLADDTSQNTGIQHLTRNTWTFGNLDDTAETPNSLEGSDAASDVAQHDSSDERALSPRDTEFEDELEPSFPGMLQYKLNARPEGAHSSYAEPSPIEDQGETFSNAAAHIWDQRDQQMHEVPPEGANEQQSDETAEIHLGLSRTSPRSRSSR
ncbi:ubiquitin carboxyl-terminal hydrolase-like protein [Xylariomycetidae sp. FL2044]|nr:ubiquitin carboxyl-terminal hydrolase-like protein [Xylariomycetidae sp. FL2044]